MGGYIVFRYLRVDLAVGKVQHEQVPNENKSAENANEKKTLLNVSIIQLQ